MMTAPPTQGLATPRPQAVATVQVSNERVINPTAHKMVFVEVEVR